MGDRQFVEGTVKHVGWIVRDRYGKVAAVRYCSEAGPVSEIFKKHQPRSRFTSLPDPWVWDGAFPGYAPHTVTKIFEAGDEQGGKSNS